MSLWMIVLIWTYELLMFPGAVTWWYSIWHAQHPGLVLSNNGVKYWCSCHRDLHCAPKSGQMLNSAPFLCRTFLHSEQGLCCSLWVRQLEQLGWADVLGAKSFCQNNIVSQAYRLTMTIFKPDGWPLSHGLGQEWPELAFWGKWVRCDICHCWRTAPILRALPCFPLLLTPHFPVLAIGTGSPSLLMKTVHQHSK